MNQTPVYSESDCVTVMNDTSTNNPSPKRFRGMMPIMPTALTPSGTIDENSQRRLVEYCIQCGAVAIGHFGIASEFHKVADRDRTRLTRIIVDAVAGRVPVFIGTTSTSVAITLDYAREAEELGADLVMAALPYVDLPDAEGAFDFYAALSEATELPIIVQDTPATSSILTAELLWRMAQEIEHVEHLKAEGKKFLEKTAALQQLSARTISVIGGAGGRHLLHLLRFGVTAFMTGTEALDLHADAVGSFLAGDEERAARVYYEQIVPYLEFYLDYSEELLKAMLASRGVIDCPDVIAPRACRPMSEVERRELDWVLDRIGFRKAWPKIP